MSSTVTFESTPCSHHQAKTSAMNSLKKYGRTLNKVFGIQSRLTKSTKLQALLNPPCLQPHKIDSVMKIVNFQLDNMQAISQFSVFIIVVDYI